MGKKAQIEIQFNWVFILIIGMVILSFFVGVANWYKKTKEKELAYKVLQSLDSIISSAGHASDTSNKLDVPNMELGFQCDPDACNDLGCSSSFGYEFAGATLDSSAIVLFSPAPLKSDYLFPWTLDFSMPFKVTNFLYLVNPDIHFVLAYDKSDAVSYNTAMSLASAFEDSNVTSFELMPIELSSESQIKLNYNNEDLLRYVVISSSLDAIAIDGLKESNTKVDVLFVYPESGSYGKLSFAKRQDTGSNKAVFQKQQSLSYISMPFLVGAIFSKDEGFFSCNVKKAMLALRHVAQLYKKRSELLAEKYKGDLVCEFIYSRGLLASFDGIIAAVEDLDNIGFNEIIQESQALEEQNLQARYKSCPSIY